MLAVPGFLIARGLTVSTARIFATIDEHLARLAKGDLPERLTRSDGPDFDQVRDSLNAVVDSLRSLIAEMSRMSAAHDAGDTDVDIDEARFAGDYRTMARSVNAMVGAHVTVKRKALAVFTEFGRGNFDAALEQLPGKRRFINEAVEQVRSNLRALVADAASLSRAAIEGRLDVRADASRQPGGSAPSSME